jgi:rod shape-determining protein MreC
VHTGHALRLGEQEATALRTTLVRMRPLGADEVEAYAATGEGLDKAGGYAIQGIGATLIDGIEGCYGAVVGLSLPAVVLAARAGWGSGLSSFVRAWYAFVGLSLLTFALTAFVGRVPLQVSAAVALPQAVLYRAGVHLRLTAEAMAERRDYRPRSRLLRSDLVTTREAARRLELQVAELERLLACAPQPVTGRRGERAGRRPQRRRCRRRPHARSRSQRSGVVRGMPVTATEGLVGLVVEVSGGTSVVRTVLDPRSRVGVTVRGKGGQGVAVGTWRAGCGSTASWPTATVEVGDVVETSAVGGLFPRGLRVGVVIEVLPQDPNELRRSFLVAPAVDLSTLLDVVLIAPP